MSRLRHFPFLKKAPEAPEPRSRAADRMDLLLRRAQQDAEEAKERDFELVFEPPSVSPWSSPEGEPELRRALAEPLAIDDNYDDEDGYADLDDYDHRRAGFDDYDDPEDDGDSDSDDPDSDDPDYDDDDSDYDDYLDDQDSEVDDETYDARASNIDPVLHAPSLDTPTLRRGASFDTERNVLPFRRRSQQRRIRRLRRHPFVRWMGPLATAMAILAVPLSVLAWFLASPSFALRSIAVADSDTQRVDPAWVRGTLSGFEGSNIWLLPLSRAEAVLLRHPWIGDVGLRKHPPHGLDVRIVERREAALYRDREQGLIYVDAEGRRIAPWSMSKDSGDLPILSGRGEETHLAAAIELVAEIDEADPPWAAGLSEVEILSELDYRLHTRDLPFPLLVRAGTVDGKARHLQALLPRILERFDTVGAVDLRFARRIIIEPVTVGSRRS